MTIDIMPAVKYSSFMVLCWVVGVLTTNLILDDLAYWWATIPAVALLGFTGYLVLRVKINREQFFLAMLIAIMVTRAVKQLSL